MEVVGGALVNPAVLGSARTVRRVTSDGTALEDYDPTRALKTLYLYPYDRPADVPGYDVLGSSPVTLPEDADTITTGAGAAPQTGTGDSYVTAAGGLGSTTIPAGSWEWIVTASVDSVAGSTTVLEALIYVRTAAGVETLLATITTPALTTTPTRWVPQAVLGADTAINASDRLVMKVQARRTVGAQARVVTWYHGGSSRFSYLRTPAVGDVALSRRDLDATRRTTHSTTGWTEINGDAGVSVVGGLYRHAIPAGTMLLYNGVGDGMGGAIYNASRIRRAPIADPWAIDARVRIAAVSGADAQTCLTLALERDNGAPGVRARCYAVRCYVGAGGSGIIVHEAQTTNVLATSGTMVATDGTGWVRLVYRPSGLSVFTGTGAGTAEPTSWQLEAQVAAASLPATPHTALNYLLVAAEQILAAAAPVTVDVGTVIETTLAEV